MKKTIIVLAFVLARTAVAYDGIEPNQCYPGNVFFYYVTQKLNKHLYEMRSGYVPAKYQQALLKTKYEFTSQGMIGIRIKLIGTQEVQMDSGFTKTLPVFEDCKKGE